MELLVWCVVQDWVSTYVTQIPEKYARVGEVATAVNGECRDYSGLYDEDPFRVLAVCAHATNRREAEMVMNAMNEFSKWDEDHINEVKGL